MAKLLIAFASATLLLASSGIWKTNAATPTGSVDRMNTPSGPCRVKTFTYHTDAVSWQSRISEPGRREGSFRLRGQLQSLVV